MPRIHLWHPDHIYQPPHDGEFAVGGLRLLENNGQVDYTAAIFEQDSEGNLGSQLWEVTVFRGRGWGPHTYPGADDRWLQPLIVRVTGYTPYPPPDPAEVAARKAAWEAEEQRKRDLLLAQERYSGPDFTITCPKCGSTNVIGEDSIEGDEDGWCGGTLDFVCVACAYRRVFYAPGEYYWTNPVIKERDS